MEAAPPEAQKRIGSLLKGKWRIDRFLGAGGMAWVFSATHRNRNRVAIKMLLPEHASNEDVRRRFLREGYVANGIGHPGVVLIYDDDEDDDGTAFLVMELLEGATLAELRRASMGWLETWTVIRIAEQLLDVLASAHERSVVHRDVKPGNLFLTRAARLKILDFGIARLGSHLHGDEPTESGAVMGSVAYMAPEQAQGRWDRVDARADVWAAGATLFRLLTGEYVHPARDIAELVEMAATRPARRLADVAPNLPPSLAAVIDRALAFEAADRWVDAASMKYGLADAIADLDPPEPGQGDLAALIAAHLRAHPPEADQPTSVDLIPRAAATVAATPRATLRPPALAVSRHEAVGRLAEHGLRGTDLYMVDTIPLLEMIWADGRVQAEELTLLDAFLRRHVRNVNELVGEDVVSFEQAREFVGRFLDERPNPELLRLLRGFVVDVGPFEPDGAMSAARRRNILDFCLDIGAACVAEYPHGDHERFCRDEKLLFESIFQTLGG